MSGVGQVVSHSGHSTDKVGSGSQVSDFSKILISMSLFGKRVFAGVAGTDNLYEVTLVRSGNLKLEQLALGGTLDQSALNLEAGADVGLANVLESLDVFCHDDLQTLDK